VRVTSGLSLRAGIEGSACRDPDTLKPPDRGGLAP